VHFFIEKKEMRARREIQKITLARWNAAFALLRRRATSGGDTFMARWHLMRETAGRVT
jgi:hypothetical protein